MAMAAMIIPWSQWRATSPVCTLTESTNPPSP